MYVPKWKLAVVFASITVVYLAMACERISRAQLEDHLAGSVSDPPRLIETIVLGF